MVKATPQPVSPDNLRLWLETWSRAVEELEGLRRVEIESVDTQEAVSQTFGTNGPAVPPAPPNSGLVEQQAWFARIPSRAKPDERTA
jgi:hypothetical protein